MSCDWRHGGEWRDLLPSFGLLLLAPMSHPGIALVSSDPHPVGGPKFAGQPVEPNQMFGCSLVDRSLPRAAKKTGIIEVQFLLSTVKVESVCFRIM